MDEVVTGIQRTGRAWRLAIVGGCGHVGLPLGLVFVDAGHEATLVDLDAERVASVLAGRMPFAEAGGETALAAALESGRLHVVCGEPDLSGFDAVVVTIGTPVDEFLDPEIRGFDRAIGSVLERMADGQLLVLRSTIFPGVTERVGNLIDRAGRKIDVAYCPERIAQGFALQELRALPQLVSGTTADAATAAMSLFESLGCEVVSLTAREAELAKLFANAYRYLNFAISNQFYMLALRMNTDFFRVHEAVTRNYPRMNGFARPGFAAGPCLLKDTMQLAAFNHGEFALGRAAMTINEGLPYFVVERLLATRDLARETVGILGMAFKGECDDRRSSLAYKLRKVLSLECERVLCTDPYVEDPELVPLEEVLESSDLLILAACHQEYRDLDTPLPIVDVFGFLDRRAGDPLLSGLATSASQGPCSGRRTNAR